MTCWLQEKYTCTLCGTVDSFIKMAAVDSFQLLLKDILEQTNSVQEALALFGLACITKVSVSCLWSFFKAFRVHTLSRLYSVDLVKNFGPWAGQTETPMYTYHDTKSLMFDWKYGLVVDKFP